MGGVLNRLYHAYTKVREEEELAESEGQPQDSSTFSASLRTDEREETINEPPGNKDQPQNVSLPSPGVQEDESEEMATMNPPGNKNLSQNASPSSTYSGVHTDERDETVIKNIRVTDAALGLRRIPTGFFLVVDHNGLEWRTENKCVTVDNDIVEWDEQIPMPSDPSATVDFRIYASFELQPTMGCGEQLRKLTITVKQLLEYNEKALAFNLFPKDGDVISPCSSLLVAIGGGTHTWSGTLASTVVHSRSHSLTIESQDEVIKATNDGHDALSRYRRHAEQQDIECSIEKFEHALHLCPPDHPCHAAAQSNLATSKFVYCQAHDVGPSFDISMSLYRDALNARPAGHLDRPRTLIQLATVHFARLKKERREFDAAQAGLLLGEAIDLSPPESHERRAAVFILQMLTKHRASYVWMDDGLLSRRDLGPGVTNMGPFELGVHLLRRFKRFGDIEDIEQAISSLERSVQSNLPWEERYLASLANLGVAFLNRYNHLGVLEDLENAISRYRDAVELAPNQHPDRPSCLSNLGNALRTRFGRLGEVSDLRDAISWLRDAVELTPNQHPEKPGCLNNLGTALLARFDRLGELSDLQDAILWLRDAVELTPNQHPDKPRRLNNLGNGLVTRFNRLGEVDDLQDAISWLRDAVELTHNQHPEKLGYLSNLGTALLACFDRLGDISDLQDAILQLRDAVELTPSQHPDKHSRLNNLGNALRTRFDRLGEVSDLQDAISRLRDAVELTPSQHPEKSGRLLNLGIALLTRFDRLGEVIDLQDAISQLRDAVELTPNQHPNKPGCLNNLGTALHTRFDRLGEVSDLQDAISLIRDAVELTPNQHPRKPGYLNNLGAALHACFDRLGEVSDLQDAILQLRDAVELTPSQHPDKHHRLNNLGNALLTRSHRLGEVSDVEEAIAQYSSSTLASSGPAAIRLVSCYHWATCAHALGHHSLLNAYATAISILPQLAWAGLSLTDRYWELVKGAGIVREAAATALDSNFPETAVEWLEQGRSIIWADLYQLRNSYDELSLAYPDHAKRLRELSTQLEQASVTRENFMSLPSEQTQCRGDFGGDPLRIQADRHRDLAIERDKLLQEIRGFSGFERFLLQKEFSRFRASAQSGPVVILNAAKERCDALIILADMEEPIHVPLPNFNLGRSTGLQNTLKELVDRSRDVLSEERKGSPKSEWQNDQWKSILSVLWRNVVKPVLDTLAFSTPGNLSRIFWCPTGPFTFLPIHAAGLYGTQYLEPGYKVSDFVVSSYTPTLSILEPLSEHDPTRRGHLRFVAIPQPESDGLSRLPGVAVELQHIRAVISDCRLGRISLTESARGTVEEVLSLMRKSDWVHFACHGVQDVQNPTASGLCLADERRLKVSDIVALSRPRGGLAFLSACQTAMGDEKLSDEAIHIAAGMLFAGYGGVVGSMWAISDRLAPMVASDVYEQLFQDDAIPDHRNAARALHNAVVRLRDNGESFSEWLPFIHVGF